MNIKINKLNRIKNSKGDIIKLLDDKKLKSSFEIYLSLINKNQIKAWKKNNINKTEIIVLTGKVKFVFYDELNNIFKKSIISHDSNSKIIILKGIWYGFQNIFTSQSKLLSLTYPRFTENNIQRKKIEEFNYNWG
tara:strand:- start:120 stop:524 length:405 start_codon:yes stop_codon:yes gene_type:complete